MWWIFPCEEKKSKCVENGHYPVEKNKENSGKYKSAIWAQSNKKAMLDIWLLSQNEFKGILALGTLYLLSPKVKSF